jgi:hypothetical protein
MYRRVGLVPSGIWLCSFSFVRCSADFCHSNTAQKIKKTSTGDVSVRLRLCLRNLWYSFQSCYSIHKWLIPFPPHTCRVQLRLNAACSKGEALRYLAVFFLCIMFSPDGCICHWCFLDSQRCMLHQALSLSGGYGLTLSHISMRTLLSPLPHYTPTGGLPLQYLVVSKALLQSINCWTASWMSTWSFNPVRVDLRKLYLRVCAPLVTSSPIFMKLGIDVEALTVTRSSYLSIHTISSLVLSMLWAGRRVGGWVAR